MIRAAKFQDVPLLEEMLREMYRDGKYATRGELCDKALRELLMGMIAQQGQMGPQASFVRIAEEGGRPVGFFCGVLDRVYHIAKQLTANDLFLYVRPGAHVKHTLQLIDAYIAWAGSNRRVIEIVLSWSDTLPGAERIAPLYCRKGFHKSGEMYEMRLDLQQEEAA